MGAEGFPLARARQMVGIQDDFNRKGLVSDQGGRKKAYFVMQRWYDELEKQYR